MLGNGHQFPARVPVPAVSQLSTARASSAGADQVPQTARRASHMVPLVAIHRTSAIRDGGGVDGSGSGPAPTG